MRQLMLSAPVLWLRHVPQGLRLLLLLLLLGMLRCRCCHLTGE